MRRRRALAALHGMLEEIAEELSSGGDVECCSALERAGLAHRRAQARAVCAWAAGAGEAIEAHDRATPKRARA